MNPLDFFRKKKPPPPETPKQTFAHPMLRCDRCDAPAVVNVEAMDIFMGSLCSAHAEVMMVEMLCSDILYNNWPRQEREERLTIKKLV
jgi:hypothetical protein